MANYRRVVRYSSIACVFSVWMGAATIASAANLFTNVAADGTLISGNDVSSVTAFGIQVRELLFFGGDLINQAFHAAALCR